MKCIAIIPKNKIERATFADGIEITEDARLLIGSKLWNATVEDADFIELYAEIDAETNKITTLYLKPKKIGYVV